MRKIHIFISGIALFLLTGAASADAQQKTRLMDRQIDRARTAGLFSKTVSPFVVKAESEQYRAKSGVKDATYLDLPLENLKNLFGSHPSALTMMIPAANGEHLEMELIRHSPLSDNFKVTTDASNGAPVAYTPGVYYRGIIKGMPGSTVALSVFDNEIMCMASTLKDGNIVVAKLQEENGGTTAGGYVMYADKNIGPMPDFCQTSDEGIEGQVRDMAGVAQRPTDMDLDKCVKVYLECDYALQRNKVGVTNTTNFITAVFNNIATLYANEEILTTISEVFVWTSPDPYPTSSSINGLYKFGNMRPTFDGDLAHLVTLAPSFYGGVAWLDQLCETPFYYSRYSTYIGPYAYSRIASSYSSVPTYSWTVECMTHEMGHNLGSPHTHACSWPGGAIDGCGPSAGYSEGCTASLPSSGTIMSYCHLVSGVGINFSNGFGELPGNLIRERVAESSCLSACATDTSGQDGCAYNSATLTIKMDNYPAEVSWNIKNSAGVIVASGDGYTGAGSTHTIPLCLPDNCYTLTMMDSYGDGICCSYGSGAYSLKKASGEVLASGGNYDDEDIKPFCFTTGAPPMPGSLPEASANLKVYPNPANEIINLEWTSKEPNAAIITLTDIVGRVVYKETMNSQEGPNKFSMRVDDIAAGIYLLNVQVNGMQYQQKVTLYNR